jgi:hypothetical protein
MTFQQNWISDVDCETTRMRRSQPQKKPAGSCEPAGWKPSNPSPDQGQKKRGREYPTTFP